MPSLNDLQLCLSVLLPLAAFSVALPLDTANEDLPEISGEEVHDAKGRSVQDKCNFIAKLLHENIKRLRDEQFQRDFGEAIINMTNFETVRIQILKSNPPAKVCLRKNFDSDKCLTRIYTGLRTYSAYLDYVERENLTASLINSAKESTTRLLNIIKDKWKDGQNHALERALHEDSAWTRKIVTHSVLYDFEVFMTETSRAIQFMTNHKMPSYIQKCGRMAPSKATT
ncbi:interleukin-6 isoform X2 [Brachyhypopomus gauderio]